MADGKPGRPREWEPERTVRVLTKFDRSAVNTLDIMAEYLRAHSETPTKIDRSSLVHTAVMEYLQRNATIVQTAVDWYRTPWKRWKTNREKKRSSAKD